MMRSGWALAAIMTTGALLATVGVRAQRTLPLRAPLASSVSDSLDGFRSRDLRLGEAELQVAGVSDYLARIFERVDSTAALPPYIALYVGYYDRQARGKTIHSPRNCLPGAGWEPLANSIAVVQTANGPVTVNRYLIKKGNEQALVFYWYQGRGRVESNEYVVKFNLLRDAALRRRSDEALVRIVVPIRGSEASAVDMANQIAQSLVPAVRTALPS